MKTRKKRKVKTYENVLELYCDIIEVEIIEEARIDVLLDETSDAIANSRQPA